MELQKPVNFLRVAGDAFPIFCELQRYRVATGARPHGHDCLEFVFVIRGSGRHCIDHEVFPLVPGDLYAIDRGTVHTFTAESELWFYNILVQPELFDERELRELSALHPFAGFLRGEPSAARPKLSFAPAAIDHLAGLLERLTSETANHGPGWRLAAKALFSQFVVDACRPTSQAREAPAVDSGPVAVALGRIHERSAEPLTVEDLAREAQVSAGHLGETFKRRTGLTIHQYLTKIRIERARALLEETELSITAICHRVGFEDSGYLSRMFKRELGTTPRAYRQAVRQEVAQRTPLRGLPQALPLPAPPPPAAGTRRA